MASIIDIQTDNSDDIVLNGDIELESDDFVSTIKAAQRRVTARFDDFLLDNVGAGLERHLLQRINSVTKYAIEDDIRRSLTSNALFSPNEYKAYILEETHDGSLPILIKFTPALTGSEYTFSTIINNQNQRSYN